MAWNPNVPVERQFNGTMTPGRSVLPTHVVCHITGTDSFESVRNEFLNSASAHYVIDKAGLLFQFVEEENQAWHAGIKSPVQAQYDKPGTDWRKLLNHFGDMRYAAGSVWLDADLHPVQNRAQATFVARPDGAEWDHYRYSRERWGEGAGPVNYEVSKRPNDHAIAIEILSFGHRTPSAEAYTDRCTSPYPPWSRTSARATISRSKKGASSATKTSTPCSAGDGTPIRDSVGRGCGRGEGGGRCRVTGDGSKATARRKSRR